MNMLVLGFLFDTNKKLIIVLISFLNFLFIKFFNMLLEAFSNKKFINLLYKLFLSPFPLFKLYKGSLYVFNFKKLKIESSVKAGLLLNVE